MSKIEVNEIDAQSGSTITVGSACKSVAVPGNVLKTNAVQASDGGNIINQCGATITIGANDDTVVLGTGAAFGGGLGAVKWETTPQTGSFQATAGRGYFMNTTSGALTITTPASPSAGDIFAVSDYARTFQTNNLTVAPHSGAKIGGVAANATLSTEGQTATFVYIDGTQGWINTQETSNSVTGKNFITATGGTITECGNCKIHTFTGPGTFTVTQVADCSANNAVGYLVVAGGGGTGRSYGGGAGAGGFREGRTNPVTPYTASPLVTTGHTVSAQGYPITVGAGGAKATPSAPANPATDGSPSVFSSFISTGGGGGGHYSNTADPSNSQRGGRPGGSGGGGADGAPEIGNGNTPPVSPAQGQNGGAGGPGGSAGGGGATAVGGTGGSPSGTAGAGGAGATTHITSSPVAYAGGGGGFGSGGPGAGGTGGGGAGGSPGVAGTANTGGGAGGTGTTPNTCMTGTGGSGIVIIRYKFQ